MRNIMWGIGGVLFFGASMIGAMDQKGVAIAGFADTQIGHEGQEKNKAGHVATLVSIIEQSRCNEGDPELKERVYAAAVVGDIVQGTTGHGKYSEWFWFFKHCCCCNGDKEQTAQFKKDFLRPLESSGVSVLESPGNHDYWDMSQAGLDMVRVRHGRMYYSQKVGPITYLACGVYPDEQIVNWLKNTIAAEKKKNKYQAFIVACHYPVLNTGYETFRWMNPGDRNALLDAIIGENVQLIMNGHDHSTYKGEAHGVPVVCSGGDILPISLFSAQGVLEKTKYFRPYRLNDGSFSYTEVSSASIPSMPLLMRDSTPEEEAACQEHKKPINQHYPEGTNRSGCLQGLLCCAAGCVCCVIGGLKCCSQ